MLIMSNHSLSSGPLRNTSHTFTQACKRHCTQHAHPDAPQTRATSIIVNTGAQPQRQCR